MDLRPRKAGYRRRRNGVSDSLSLTPFMVGTGAVEHDEGSGMLRLPTTSDLAYSDAQLHDYAGIPRREYPWRPPLHFTIEARFSSHLQGTAGFGFWNNPVSSRGLPALPRALWFFWASPPSAIELAQDVPGHGWKAATIDAGRASALAWAPFAPLVLLLCRHYGVRRRLWPWVQRALLIEERLLGGRPTETLTSHIDRTEWHRYEIYWFGDRVIFGVDGHKVLTTQRAPRAPLGLVLWLDNQWARVTPAGSFGAGLLHSTHPQWLEYRNMRITTPRT